MTRIIAGLAGGRRLSTPKGDKTRPTSDRVREALFSALASRFGADAAPADQLRGISVLDLYSGSGALALEAASRGARPVAAVESNKAAAAVIEANARATGLDVQVHHAPVESVAASPGQQQDLVFADPPYDVSNEALSKVLEHLVANGWVGDTLLVIERATRSGTPRWPPQVEEVWSRRYGETTLHFGRCTTEEP